MATPSVPATFTPMGLLMPVASMSMRLRMGGIQMLARPGSLTAASNSSTSFSGVMPGRHWSRGLSWMVVSNISIGAGSVAVSARPALPKTRATSGTVLIMRSVCCSNSPALAALRPGSAVGMYSRSPSSSGGRNSPPRRAIGHSVVASTSSAASKVALGQRSTPSSTGRYSAISTRLMGLRFSSGMRPRIHQPISTGIRWPTAARQRPSHRSWCRPAGRRAGPPAPAA
jgi:hypothetical protein